MPFTLLGILATAYGIIGLKFVLSAYEPTSEGAEDILDVIIILLIGLGSLFVAIRWGRYAIDRTSRDKR